MLTTSRRIRLFAFVNNIILFIFSVIVVGLLSHMLKAYPVRGGHIVYQEVIAVITLFIWTVTMAFPLLDRYKGWFAVLNLVFSYLWLASFIFNAERLGGPKCNPHGPLAGHCSFKKAAMAFTFLVFFFLIIGFVLEVLLFRSESILARAARVAAAASSKEHAEVLLTKEGSEEVARGEKTVGTGASGGAVVAGAGGAGGAAVVVGGAAAGATGAAGAAGAGRIETGRIEIGRVEVVGGRLDAGGRMEESGRCEEARRFEKVGRGEEGRCQEAVRFEQVGRTEESERFEQVGRTEVIRQYEEVDVQVQQGETIRQFGGLRTGEIRGGDKGVRRY